MFHEILSINLCKAHMLQQTVQDNIIEGCKTIVFVLLSFQLDIVKSYHSLQIVIAVFRSVKDNHRHSHGSGSGQIY